MEERGLNGGEGGALAPVDPAASEAAALAALDGAVVEQVVIGGDLARLAPAQRVAYYRAVCRSLGLNELTQPFEYIRLQDRLRLYAKREATDQLRRLHRVSVEIIGREQQGDLYVVTARATTPDGRTDESTGAVCLTGLSGANLANALMKAECVPLDSEILTRDGFRRYDQLTIGEDVLAYDVLSDRSVWTPLDAVTVYDSAPLIRLFSDHRQFEVLCTPDHSWAIRTAPYEPSKRGDGSRGPRGPYANRQPERRLVQATHIKTNHRLILAAPEIATGESRQIVGAFLKTEPAGHGPVWCPTTAYGTWVMRQNGRVTITGNTKAKRRVTLSICGLGWLDESEVDSVPVARRVTVTEAGKIVDAPPAERHSSPAPPRAGPGQAPEGSRPSAAGGPPDREKLLHRWHALCREADSLGVDYDPLPIGAGESTIVEHGVALKRRVLAARRRAGASGDGAA